MQEQIWQVDENDSPIGSIGRDDSRKTGARYRIVRVSVEDGNGNVLLQKRLGTKKTYPGCWDTSAGGNIAYGESYEDAASRELREETGIDDVSLQEVAYFYGEAVDPEGRKMNRFTKVYRAVVPQTIEVKPQPEEVTELVWKTPKELKKIVAEGKVTDGLRQTAEYYYRITAANNEAQPIVHDEPWQAYHANGTPLAGVGLKRADFTEDLIMGASHVWLWRQNGEAIELLLQKRAFTKKTWPGYYDISAAGHIDAGETSLESAIRETREEIGLVVDPEKLEYIFSLRTPVVPNEIDHVYLYEVSVNFTPSFDDGEVDSVVWCTIDDLKQRAADPERNNLVNQGRGYFELLFEYADKL